ncbi:hypothetical protein C2845_PM09G04340 [Panicum miliaceum]|uniref:Uncharacterized protein n=1 Tax=Panicum miliaceum TaxID=4540 RepID=A0A3L6S4K3_PANMI|nr:hypothetical protein C2845_PM09G04340 [Panicum miliaceum]
MAHCYSNFKLTMNSSEQVSCKCIEQEGLHDMLRRVKDESVLPILTPAPLSASSKPFETGLKRKLNLKLSKEELELYNMCAIDDPDENEELTQQQQSKHRGGVRDKPKREVTEVELRDCSLLFQP